MSSCPSLEPEACLEDGLGRAGGPRARPQATAAANRSPHLRLPSCKGSLWVPRLGLFDVQGRWTDAQGPPPTRGRTVCGQAQAPQVPASLVRNTPTGRPPPICLPSRLTQVLLRPLASDLWASRAQGGTPFTLPLALGAAKTWHGAHPGPASAGGASSLARVRR